MGEENKNWFARHRTAVFGIAVAVLILNLVVLVAVPTQTPVELSQTVTEYCKPSPGRFRCLRSPAR